MSFVSIGEILQKWTKKKNIDRFLKKQEILKKIQEYFYEIKKFDPNLVKILDWQNGNLKIKCLKSVLTHQIRLKEKEIKDYFWKNFNIKIEKIFYQL